MLLLAVCREAAAGSVKLIANPSGRHVVNEGCSFNISSSQASESPRKSNAYGVCAKRPLDLNIGCQTSHASIESKAVGVDLQSLAEQSKSTPFHYAHGLPGASVDVAS